MRDKRKPPADFALRRGRLASREADTIEYVYAVPKRMVPICGLPAHCNPALEEGQWWFDTACGLLTMSGFLPVRPE